MFGGLLAAIVGSHRARRARGGRRGKRGHPGSRFARAREPARRDVDGPASAVRGCRPGPAAGSSRIAPRRRTPMESTIPAALSRPAALAGLGASGLGLALAARPISAAAQEASPTATAATLPPLVAEWQAAVASHDLDRILALFTPDGIWEEVPLNVFAQGQDAIRAH